VNRRQRVLYILVQYPQLSETYIRAEIMELQDEFDLSIVSMIPADYPYERHTPFKAVRDAR
jgi:hypothetical protein